MSITIFCTDTVLLMKQQLFPQLLKRLPLSLQSRAIRYQSELSAYNYVVGRLLLKHGLESFGHDSDLKRIEYEDNGKPTLPGVHFNISHSSHQVICAFSTEGQLGIDLEKITPIDFADFTSMFSIREWAAIKSADEPIRAFYWFWTRKESIIKALGLKLSYLHQIDLDVCSDYFVVEGQRWYLRDINVGEGCMGSLCCEIENEELEVIEIQF